jgi:hypothetical protein
VAPLAAEHRRHLLQRLCIKRPKRVKIHGIGSHLRARKSAAVEVRRVVPPESRQCLLPTTSYRVPFEQAILVSIAVFRPPVMPPQKTWKNLRKEVRELTERRIRRDNFYSVAELIAALEE